MQELRASAVERTISLIKMSLHVAEISFDISGHLHAQLLIELPLLLYLRCTRAKDEQDSCRQHQFCGISWFFPTLLKRQISSEGHQ